VRASTFSKHFWLASIAAIGSDSQRALIEALTVAKQSGSVLDRAARRSLGVSAFHQAPGVFASIAGKPLWLKIGAIASWPHKRTRAAFCFQQLLLSCRGPLELLTDFYPTKVCDERNPRTERNPPGTVCISLISQQIGFVMPPTRTTHRSTSGSKLYAERDKQGRFKDIQTYKRAHGQDVKRSSKEERAKKQ